MSATLAQLRAVIREEISRLPATEPHALKRTAAAKAMGISTGKLDGLIASGKVRTAEDPRLVPMSEVKRYCAPKTPRQRRRLGGHRVRRTVDGQSDEAWAEMKRKLRSAK